MKKQIFIFIALVLFIVLAWFYQSYQSLIEGALPAITSPDKDITKEIDEEHTPLSLPPGFEIEVVSEEVPGARDIAQGPLGNLWVSQTREGAISLVTLGEEQGKAAATDVIFEGLNNPHGLAFDPQERFVLYVAEEDKVSRIRTYTDGVSFEKVADLPAGGRHTTRTIAFGPDGKLYVSIGSTCNVCDEENEERAAIIRMNKDGSERELYATGLRNAVFFTWSYVDPSNLSGQAAKMWATEMGRDWLGDDLPPDEINIIEKGGWYGWPWFYGKNAEDTAYKPGVTPGFAKEPIPSTIDIQAHSAPLGLAFVPEDPPAGGWPEGMWYDLLVAYHGSWNRSEPTGYKIVRMKLDENGNYSGTEDFATGWLQEDGDVLGRPVDLLIRPGGVLYVSDDKAGVIYRVSYTEI